MSIMGIDFFALPATHPPTSLTMQTQQPSTTLTTPSDSVSTGPKLNWNDVRLTNQAHKLQDRRLAIDRKKAELDLDERQLKLDEEKFELLKAKRLLDEEDEAAKPASKKAKSAVTKAKASGRPAGGAKKTTPGVAKNKSTPATRRIRLKTSNKRRRRVPVAMCVGNRLTLTTDAPIKVETESETEKAHEEDWGGDPAWGFGVDNERQ